MHRVRRSIGAGVVAVMTSAVSVCALSAAVPMAGAATPPGEELQVCALGVLGLAAPCETVPLPQSAAGMQSALSNAITALCPKLPSYGQPGGSSAVSAGCSFSSAQDEETYVINVWDGALVLLTVTVSASPCGVQQVAFGPEEQQFSSLFVDLLSLHTTDCQLS
jgi:hypothetical protein